ncbi:uncharacterized protein LOC133468814 isoform X9 [Phyllopteryx taeniolatus]|uniref:uncharacterized protein LOC133468814 isoform X9 n=1 Tax=Phyllopteryx taeniolatus TaxID=161469 RepID=UPI002AD2483F|nr:uncharacterized protein LOC133468814 isoform X9 [Phyllopteryx taeniolatus]
MCAGRVKEEEAGEEVCAAEEKERKRQLLDAFRQQPRVVLHKAEDLRPEKQEPETPHVKRDQQEDPIAGFPLAGVTLKNADDEGDHCGGTRSESVSAQRSDSDDVTSHSSDYDEEDDDEQSKDVGEEDLQESPHSIKKEEEPETPHMKDEEQEDQKFPLIGVTLKDEDDDGDRWGGSQSEDLSAPLSERDDVTSHSSDDDDNDDEEHSKADVSEEDLRPEKQEPETPHVKDEEQQDEISKFPLTGVALKDEDDDGDRWGGSQSEDPLGPLSERDDVTSHSSDYDEAEEDDDDDDDDDKDEHAKVRKAAL